jgi:nucleoside-diphosphate-sugar epimerase
MTLILDKPLPIEDMQFIAKHVNADKLRSMYGVVTGATGWFGQWICAALDFMGCEYSKVDTRRLYPFKADYCIHLAPKDASPLIQMLDKADVKHVLFTSSGSVYDKVPSENCIEKKANEDLFIKSGLPVNIARCFSFIGPGVCQKELAPGIFIKAYLENKPIGIINTHITRTYMYMSDLVIWLLKILLADKVNVYDVGSAERITPFELAIRIKAKMNAKSELWMMEGNPDPRPNYVPCLQFAQEDLGLRVRVDLDTALDKTIEWERK